MPAPITIASKPWAGAPSIEVLASLAAVTMDRVLRLRAKKGDRIKPVARSGRLAGFAHLGEVGRALFEEGGKGLAGLRRGHQLLVAAGLGIDHAGDRGL